MKKTIILTIGILFLCAFAANAQRANFDGAETAKFNGVWENAAATKGLKKINIETKGNRIYVQISASCQPTDCVWETQSAQAFFPNIDAREANALKVEYNKNGIRRMVLIEKTARDRLRVYHFAKYDSDERKNIVSEHDFRKSSVASDVAKNKEPELPVMKTTSVTGTWQNTDAKTGGVTKIELTNSGGNYSSKAWGQCSPEDCDWGTVKTTKFAPSVSSNETAALIAVYPSGNQRTVFYRMMPNNTLQATVLTEFRGSRQDTFINYTFKKSLKLDKPIIKPPLKISVLPDLKIDRIYLDASNQVVVVVSNAGRGAVPDSVWTDKNPKSASVLIKVNGNGWGGATIWKEDDNRRLKNFGRFGKIRIGLQSYQRYGDRGDS